MKDEQYQKFNEFLNISERQRAEEMCGVKMTILQRISFWFANKWWSMMRKSNQHLRAETLWESIVKGRF